MPAKGGEPGVMGWREGVSMSHLPHPVVLAERASHARRSEERGA
jgi:hypothetical protein